MMQKEGPAAANSGATSKNGDIHIVAERNHERQERRRVDLVGDYHQCAQAVTQAVVETVGGRGLFVRGGVIVERVEEAHGVVLRPVTRAEDVHRVVLQSVALWKQKKDGFALADGLPRDLVGIVRGHLERALPEVSRISTAPVIRPDGTIVTETGFDEVTGVFVDLAPDVRGIIVPENPTPADIAAAVHLLRDVLFEMDGVDGFDGWLFGNEADRVHAIAFLLTTLLRSAMPTAPMIVANGLQRGVGKGALIDVVHRVAYGVPPAVMGTPRGDVELEKRVTADLMAGRSMIVLDEIMDEDRCILAGARSVTAALTSQRWAGRLLGRSESLVLDQTAVWAATGNNVSIPGDLQRRILQIRLTTSRPAPDERSNFRRDLGPWVDERRAELLRAALVLIRAWYAQGQPEAPRPFGFVGFTEWQRIIGGICHVAGLAGFLDGVLVMRQEDPDQMEWAAHLEYVHQLVGDSPFTAREVFNRVQQQQRHDDSTAPPFYGWSALDARVLGRLWSGIAGRWIRGLRISRVGKAHGNAVMWKVEHLATVDVAELMRQVKQQQQPQQQPQQPWAQPQQQPQQQQPQQPWAQP